MTDNTKRAKVFIKELIDLMNEHGVNFIGGEYDGDTHGTYDDRFSVTFNGSNFKETVIYNHSTSVDTSDLSSFLNN